MKRNVYLEGELGEKYGKVREIEANNVAEVFQCLAANFKDFTQYLIELDEKGFDLRCQALTRTQLSSPRFSVSLRSLCSAMAS